MKTVLELSLRLRSAVTHQGLTQAELKTRAGISQRTLTNVLSGHEDFKVSTLLSLADRLGLELLLVPKSAVRALESTDVTPPVVRSVVSAALDRVREQVKANDER